MEDDLDTSITLIHLKQRELVNATTIKASSKDLELITNKAQIMNKRKPESRLWNKGASVIQCRVGTEVQ